jgi:CRP-like cAMP-binding protein
MEFVQSPPLAIAFTRQERDTLKILNVASRHYPPHTTISRQGEVESRLFMIKSGWGCIYRDLASGSRQIIDTPLMGDIIGIRAAEGPNSNSLASISELSLFEFPRQLLSKTLHAQGRLATLFARVIARHHSILTEHLMNAGRRNALVRTAHYLLELRERLAPFGMANDAEFDCPLTQEELADVLGLTPIHVNRTLRELRVRKLLSFRRGLVELTDRPSLVKLCGFDSGYLRL